MKPIVKSALFALAVAVAPLMATSAPASAATDFSITLGNAAFGYNDGYWDRDHHWHAWRNRRESAWFREHNRDHYYAMRHDHDRKDKNQGWRDEKWWDRH